MSEADATIGHNSIPAGIMIDEDPSLIYKQDNLLPDVLKEIRDEIANREIDLDTAKGREAISALSASISRRKVKITDAGKKLTEDWRKKTAEVNAVKSKVEGEFDTLRDLARKPLTDWEAAKKKREDEINSTIAKIDWMGIIDVSSTASSVRDRLDWLSALVITDEAFGAFQPIAAGKRQRVIETLEAALARIEQAERDKAELERLRAANAAREAEEKKEADKIAAEKAEQDRIAQAAAQAIEDERDRAQREIDQANARADEVERAAEQDRLARAAEQKRIDDAAAAQRAADDARAANQKHRGKIMGEAKTGLMTHAGITEDVARVIVLAIVAGSIPNTSIKF